MLHISSSNWKLIGDCLMHKRWSLIYNLAQIVIWVSIWLHLVSFHSFCKLKMHVTKKICNLQLPQNWVWPFDLQEEDDEEKAVIGFWSAFTWLVGMTLVISLLSEYVVGTIEVYVCIICNYMILVIVNYEFSMSWTKHK